MVGTVVGASRLLNPNPYSLFAWGFIKLRGRFNLFFPPLRTRIDNSDHSQPKTSHCSFSTKPIKQNRVDAWKPSAISISSPALSADGFPVSGRSGLVDVMMGYLLGKTKATEVAHSVWGHIVKKGDTVIDATCGNGYDTLALVKLVADSDKTLRGCVYALDIQKVALENAMSLLDESLNPDEKELVQLFETCHSKMQEVLPKRAPVRLVAFNLGYLPGGDKAKITRSGTTLLALEAAKEMLAHGGLISIVVYVGHPGGREEYQMVRDFGYGLAVEEWVCCELQMLNRPLAPVLVFMFKR